MNRSGLQDLAELRVREAEVLLSQKLFDGAYYLLGYAVECAFKACIAKVTKQYDFPPNKKTVEAIYQHDPAKLLKASGLEVEHKKETQVNSGFAYNWKIVQSWSEQLRYQTGKSEAGDGRFLLSRNRQRGNSIMVEEVLVKEALSSEMISAGAEFARHLQNSDQGISGIRFSQNVINGVLIDDAYIYKLS